MNERYSRQMLFGEIGREGQGKLLASRVLLVGCGALGAAHAEMLARAGIGSLRIVDRDFVEFTNLQRQTLYKESDAAERHHPCDFRLQERTDMNRLPFNLNRVEPSFL